MANIHKTSRGTVLDMDKLRLANEHVIAVGNMKVNARGDKISGGKVIESKNSLADKAYAMPDPAPYSPNAAPDQ